MRRLTNSTLTVLALLLLVSTTMSQVPQKSDDKRIVRGGVGARVGVTHESRYYIDGGSYELKPSFGLGVFFDVAFAQRHAVTLTADLHDVNLFGSRALFLNLAAGWKPTFYYSDRRKLAWRGYGTVGFAHLAEIGQLEASTYLTFKVGAEVLFFQNKNIAYVFGIDITGSPRGGDGMADVTWGPIWALRAGVMY